MHYLSSFWLEKEAKTSAVELGGSPAIKITPYSTSVKPNKITQKTPEQKTPKQMGVFKGV